jgi:hypothetical protein
VIAYAVWATWREAPAWSRSIIGRRIWSDTASGNPVRLVKQSAAAGRLFLTCESRPFHESHVIHVYTVQDNTVTTLCLEGFSCHSRHHPATIATFTIVLAIL